MLVPHIAFLLLSCLVQRCSGEFDASHNRNLEYVVDSISANHSKQQTKISQELLVLESQYQDMLSPVRTLKKENPKVYWFIVSWLNTAYNTPNWTGYYSETWRKSAKQNGIDCSGFARVFLDRMYDIKVAGSSQGIFDHYCDPIPKSALKMGDLVFFRAPYADSDRIVHVGVYLINDYFVHATSKKSAAEGKGLSINALSEVNWSKEFVTGGRLNSRR